MTEEQAIQNIIQYRVDEDSSSQISSESESEDLNQKRNQTAKDRSSLFERRCQKLKLERCSYHPDSIIRKRSSIFYFEIHGLAKNTIDKKNLYEKLSSIDVKWKKQHHLVKPKCLIVDLRTSCLEYLEEQNLVDLYSTQDIVYIYLDFHTQINSEILDIYLDEILSVQFYVKHYSMKKPKMNVKSFEDRELLFHGLSFEEFNEKVAAWQWAKKFENKSYANDFFYQRFKSKLNLDAVIERLRRPAPEYQCLRPIIQLKKFGNFYDKVVKWYNKRVTRGFEHKNKQLYVYGDANKGKSYIVNALLGGLDHQKFVLRQNDKSFILDGWDPYKYSHIICDEVNLDNFDQEIYKLITEGAQISANRKNEKATVVSCRVPMIFLSNQKPKQYPGLYERLKFVKADNFVKILNINDYLKFDWSIAEKELRCQPNPQLMPIFKCLNTLPPNQTQISAIEPFGLLTPEASSTSFDLSSKSKISNKSSLISSDDDEENFVETESVKRPSKSKNLVFDSENENEPSFHYVNTSSFGNYTINDLLNGSFAANDSLDIFASLDKLNQIIQKKAHSNLFTSSPVHFNNFSPQQNRSIPRPKLPVSFNKLLQPTLNSNNSIVNDDDLLSCNSTLDLAFRNRQPKTTYQNNDQNNQVAQNNNVIINNKEIADELSQHPDEPLDTNKEQESTIGAGDCSKQPAEDKSKKTKRNKRKLLTNEAVSSNTIVTRSNSKKLSFNSN